MPEGDNILRSATVLGPELTGRTIDALFLHDRGEIKELQGKAVESVRAVGKHLLIAIEGGWTLRVHLGMHGTWRRRHRLESPGPRVTVRLVTGDAQYICARSYRAELVRSAALRQHPMLGRLGPDLLAEPPDIDEAVRRARIAGYANREIGELVLDQRVAAGIGNIYKSETLFECRVHPRTRMHQLDEAQVRAIFEKAAALMRLNLLIRRHRNVPLRRREEAPSTKRLWVYMRKGKPCLDCGTLIERILQGDHGRSTYFCPNCQRIPEA